MSGSATSTLRSRVAGSSAMSSAPASLRMTWGWSWLSGGTSITQSASTRAWQPSLRPGASPRISS